jgi:pyruvate dehydrogenase E2 component (dihydrolipoamide acetyltransferase)
MAVSIVMPALELAQDTGRLVSWRKKEGDRVEKGEAVAEIETDKAVVEIEAPGDGILTAISAREGTVVPVGRTIAWLVAPGESPPDALAHTAGAHRPAPATSHTGAVQASRPAPRGVIRISPKARRLAKEHGIDVAALTGSGPDGEILADDVESAIRSGSSIRDQQPAISAAGRLMAERTTQSWTTIPHFFVSRDVDATALNAARAQSADFSHTDLLVSLVARALARHPRLNASWIDGAIRMNREVNIAIAIAVDDAVVAGVIHRADAAALADIAVRRRALIERSRAGRLQPSDIAGATFTISNLGMYQVDTFTAIIVPPQAGILAVGAISDRVVAVSGQPRIRPMMTMTLSCDHRVVDGARAAAFLNDAVRNLESGIWNSEAPARIPDP